MDNNKCTEINKMKIFIQKNDRSYSPEIYAYKDYLEKNNYKVDIGFETEFSNEYDAVMLLMGFFPKFRSNNYNKVRTIHEYSSLSLYPFSKIKNYLKHYFNSIPDARIFNSPIIKKDLFFNNEIPYIFRDTGIDNIFYKNYKINKDFDFVYSGSTNSVRKGLLKSIEKILKIGFSILVVGKVSKEVYEYFKKYNKIEFTGFQPYKELPKIYQRAYYGLNFTPNLYPLNLQNSTKTKEYCASGLKVISNKYQWVFKFEKDNNAKFYWYDDFITEDKIRNYNFKIPNVEKYSWKYIFEDIKFKQFIDNILSK